MKLELSGQIFNKSSNVKFHQNPSIGSRVVPCGQTDMGKLIVAFRNFANAPKNCTIFKQVPLWPLMIAVDLQTCSLPVSGFLLHSTFVHIFGTSLSTTTNVKIIFAVVWVMTQYSLVRGLIQFRKEHLSSTLKTKTVCCSQT